MFSSWIQALLQEAHDVEVKKQKAEEKIVRQLAFNKEDTATEVTFISVLLLKSVVIEADRPCSCVLQETVFKEQVEGLVEEDDDGEAAEAANEQDHVAVGAITLSEKKTERQRKKEKAEKLKVNLYFSALQTFPIMLFNVPAHPAV